MIRTLTFAGLTLAATVPLPAVYAAVTSAQAKYAPCLSYYQVGDSGKCQPEVKKAKATKPVSKTASVLPPPEEVAEEAAPEKRPLQERIKEYMADHGKPPKEYVAFYLEPTIENAIKWVHTYNEILERNKRITYAWGQAEKLYDTAVAQGADMSQFNNPEDGDVVDFGIEVEGYKRPEGLAYPEGDPRNEQFRGQGQAFPPSIGGGFNQNAPQLVGAGGNITAGGITVPQPPNMTPGLPNNLQPNVPMTAPNPLLAPPQDAFNFGVQNASFTPPAPQPLRPSSSGSIGGAAPIEVTYYFSAECPFCQKFEPGFNQLIAEMGSQLDVTCVDMTPSGARQTNINGKVDCAWRPPGLGETERLGIKKTPSVTIKKPGSNRLERVVGFVEPARLKAYLTTGEVQ